MIVVSTSECAGSPINTFQIYDVTMPKDDACKFIYLNLSLLFNLAIVLSILFTLH